MSEKIKNIREIILNNVAFIEAALDDPEHFDIDANVDNLKNEVENCLNNVDNLLKTCDNGRIMHDGVRTVILGKTNAGKSSLLNVLAREERAIVTDIEGTTRDTLEEMINLSGITLNLIDTAGIRKTDDVVESIGVNKAKKLAEIADLVIYVVDSSRVLDDNDYEIMELIKDKKVLVILNKADLAQVTTAEDIKKIINCETVTISAKQETGIEELEETVKSMFFNGEVKFNEDVYITSTSFKLFSTFFKSSLCLVLVIYTSSLNLTSPLKNIFLTVSSSSSIPVSCFADIVTVSQLMIFLISAAVVTCARSALLSITRTFLSLISSIIS